MKKLVFIDNSYSIRMTADEIIAFCKANDDCLMTITRSNGGSHVWEENVHPTFRLLEGRGTVHLSSMPIKVKPKEFSNS